MVCPYIDRRCGTHAQCNKCKGGNKMSRVFYEGYNGVIYEKDEVARAFYLSTGISPENEPEFMKWLYKVFGKSIKCAFSSSPRELFDKGRRVLAIKLYREENNCSLIEARKAIDSWEEVSE